MFQSYYKGANLVEELAFSRYFHNHVPNICVHMYTFFSTWALFNLILIAYFGYSASVIVQGVMLFCYWTMVPECAVPYPIIITLCSYLIGLLDCSTSTLWMWAIVNQIVVANTSHYFLEGFFPAFRGFEVFMSTPVFVMLYIIQLFGIKTELYNQVVEKTPMWKGSEQKRDISKTINSIKSSLGLSTK